MSIWKPYQAITLRASGPCTYGSGWGGWYGYHSTQGLSAVASFDHTSSTIWDVYDWDDLGGYTWRPGGAYDSSYNELSQNTVSTSVRLHGAAWISSYRSGSIVTLTGTALTYSPTTEGFVKRAYAAGQFQYRDRGTSTWRTLVGVKTGSNGTVRFQLRNNVARDYRFATYSTPTIWDVVSASTTR
ncbi:hypothetical protein VV01_03055 [Luteipulveratus halotolerans]|uniref:Uncharacterized protein n=1 Tax=Luteipulveratus halotolerans TaxID=1631356 RepID=A0A0L6CEP1_9MICO|nr:hypothetical protein VV01_03055 [Luteipulveratus halotolerans]